MDVLRGRHNFISTPSFPSQCLRLHGFLTEVLSLLWRFSGAPGLHPSADPHAVVWVYLPSRPLKLLNIYNLSTVAMPTTMGELLDMAVLWPPCRGGQFNRSVAQGN